MVGTGSGICLQVTRFGTGLCSVDGESAGREYHSVPLPLEWGAPCNGARNRGRMRVAPGFDRPGTLAPQSGPASIPQPGAE
jgi:hypothetical protein